MSFAGSLQQFLIPYGSNVGLEAILIIVTHWYHCTPRRGRLWIGMLDPGIHWSL